MEIKIPEIELSLKFKNKVKANELFQIKSSADCYKLCKQIFNSDMILYREEFILICLNNSNRVVGYTKISSGGYNSTVVDIRFIMSIALNCAASSIIIAHNHPSGEIKESNQDLAITKQIMQAGEIMNIKLLDHLIITDSEYNSLSDGGKM